MLAENNLFNHSHTLKFSRICQNVIKTPMNCYVTIKPKGQISTKLHSHIDSI